ncbi:MAG: orotate phosphoribosyltransferase [Lachnospiraceae bacterium]|nr:orotate phosphoribosyltransferase [Lachnospiraceae bacterium]
MEQRVQYIYSKKFPEIKIRVIPGHFVTSHSHINYYVDLTMTKMRESEARAVARAIASKYSSNTIVDTIVCMDGCEVIGAYLAEELTRAGIISMNAHKTIYVVSPEFNSTGQIIFRDNTRPMIEGKNVFLLLASTTTGMTLHRCLECIHYYEGHITGITSVFSMINSICKIPISSLFKASDIPDYKVYDHGKCPLCDNHVPIDAFVNGYGYSPIKS